MNHIGVSPTRTKPISYNPLRAGQFRGYGGCNVIPSHTTIINNNNIFMDSYGYGNFNCCQDNGLTKGEKIMVGLGAGMGILGTILSFFGVGKNTEKGGPEPEPETEKQEPVNTQTQVTPEQETEPATPATRTAAPAKVETPTTQQSEEPAKADYSFIKDGAPMTCKDLSGKTQNITGTLSQVTKDANGVPQSFVLTDSGSGNRYKYEVQIADDGTITYNCVSKNETPVVGAPKKKKKNGELVQDKNQNGYKFGITTQATATPTKTAAPAKTTTPSKTTQAETPAQTTTTQEHATPLKPNNSGNEFTTETPYYNWSTGKYTKFPETGAPKNTNSNSNVELKYEYKDHRGHFYANGKEISQREYMKLKKEQEAQKAQEAKNQNDVNNAENKLSIANKMALKNVRAKIDQSNLSQAEKQKYHDKVNQLIINYNGKSSVAIQNAIYRAIDDIK